MDFALPSAVLPHAPADAKHASRTVKPRVSPGAALPHAPDYRPKNRMDSKRIISWCVIALMHGAFFYALNTGLVTKVSVAIPSVLTTIIIPEQIQPKEPPKPLPEPKKIVPPMEKVIPVPQIDYTPPPMVFSGATPVRETTPPPAQAAVIAPASPAPSPVVAAQPKTISSGVEYIQPPRPEYPAMSRRKGEEGVVQFRVLVNEQGRAERIELVKSSDSPRLDEAARIAVKNAVFKPFIENGRAISIFTIVPISFHLG